MSTIQAFTRFEIIGLRGQTNIIADIHDNTLILVGENGSGKTTFLRILFYFLSGRWNSLAQFDFSSVTAVIGDDKHTIEYKDLPKLDKLSSHKLLRKLPPSMRERFEYFSEKGLVEEAQDLLRRAVVRYDDILMKEYSLYMDDLNANENKLSQLQEKLKISLGAQILYLPTYRRIERELSSIFQGMDPDEKRRNAAIRRQSEDAPDYIELVEFGMKDVEAAIDNALESIRSFQLVGTTRLSLSYLGDVVSGKYLNPDTESIIGAPNTTIEAVLNRVDATILNIYDKTTLRNLITSAQNGKSLSEHERIIYHYFTKLIEFQRQLEFKEKNIRYFCKICSEYIADKIFMYDSSDFTFNILHAAQNKAIKLSELSSGEKQIVSLFSHLYLSGREHFFVLIDEPELSLSVPWQKRFLLDIKYASFCSGLVAVTHSPFIYDNVLRGYTHGLGEFVSNADMGSTS